MATTASTRPPSARRPSPTSSANGHAPSPSIARGATARSAVSSRVSTPSAAAARRASLKSGPPPVLHGETRESLAAALKQETEAKEKLLLQLQDKEQAISSLKSETHNLSSTLHSAETRLSELYADQNRMEEEMSSRMEVIEKLRIQVKDLEKEKRDTLRRYNEQTATFEAERQAFYDNEQHLKSRIQSLTQARRQPQPVPPSPSTLSVASAADQEDEQETRSESPQIKQDMSDPQEEPAEMTALKLELSTLSTSHASLQATLALLQSQLNDLQRVSHELQEENESYNILLREKTLSGQFDIMRMNGAGAGDVSDHSGDDEDIQDSRSLGSRSSGRSRSTLDPVDELAEEQDEQEPKAEQRELDPAFEQADEQTETAQLDEPASRNTRSRHGRKRSSVIAPHGESLANLPITGPGLDLAAELGRAENKDMLDGQTTTLEDRTILNKSRKHKKTHETSRKVSATSEPGIMEPSGSLNDIEYLRNEVKSLKDANKALSLYASKIIDRIISQEGFEHVLAADYEKVPPRTPATPATTFDSLKSPSLSAPTTKARPQSAIFPRSANTSPNLPHVERLTTFDSLNVPMNKPPPNRASRRSLSFDWKSFSMFGGGGDKKAEPPATLRPLTLNAKAPAVSTARKLDTYEDEEDRRERERLNATMKLMGIEKPAPSPSSPIPPMLKSFSTPAQGTDNVNNLPPSPALTAPTSAASPTPTARFSFFRRSLSMASRSEASSTGSSHQGSPRPPAAAPHLTQEALEQAEAVNNLAALDAHERQLSAEISKGSGGGFTEIVRRNAGERRSSRRSGSGSTVWSAGMSKHEDGDD